MVKKQRNKKKIYSKKRVLRGGEINTAADIDDEGIHSLLTGLQHRFGDKEELLTKDVCLKWFNEIKSHKSYHPVILDDGSVRMGLGTDNAKEAVRLCQEFHPELTLERKNSDDEFDTFIITFSGMDFDVLKEVLYQIKRKFVELKLLVTSSNNPTYNTEYAIKKLRETFIDCTRRLLSSSKSITSSPDITSLYKNLTKLFGKLVFKIVSQPTSETAGFFIEVEKHSFLGLHSSSSVSCELLKLFDDFVNETMDYINNSTILMEAVDSTTSVPPNKRLFLVLTSVGESYKKLINDCGIKKPSMEYGIFTSMRELGLPISEHAKLRDNCTITDSPFASDAISEGGSKSRRRHRHKLVRKTRRGCKSKPKTLRRRHAHHSHTRKHKKYTY